MGRRFCDILSGDIPRWEDNNCSLGQSLLQTLGDPARMPAMISQDLLDMLVCPVCHKPLNLKDNGQALKCGVCRRVYPIQDDIPILLIDEAKIDPS
jgi:uncharacterized protein YbaR (Trm112 family)